MKLCPGLRIAACLGGVAALSGCFGTHLDYPSSWPAPDKSRIGGCPDLSGRFENNGETGATLFYLVSRFRPAPVGREVRVVQPSDAALELHLYRSDPSPMESVRFSRDKGDFDCEAGWLTFKTLTEAEAEQGSAAVGTRTIALARSADGFIVAKRRMSAVGLMLIFPVGVSETEWFRFGPVSTEAKPEPQPVYRKAEPALGL